MEQNQDAGGQNNEGGDPEINVGDSNYNDDDKEELTYTESI